MAIIMPTKLYHQMKRALEATDAYLEHPDLYNRHETRLDVMNVLKDLETARKTAQNRRVT